MNTILTIRSINVKKYFLEPKKFPESGKSHLSTKLFTNLGLNDNNYRNNDNKNK